MNSNQNRPEVILPCFGEDWVTIIEQEAAFLQTLTKVRMYDYVHTGIKTNGLAGLIMQVLKHHAKRSVKISRNEQAKLVTQIDAFVKKDKPILITLSVCLGGRVQNKLKFFESTNLPTFAWLHLGWYFKMINEKIKQIYEPGIKVILMDEATLFFDILGIAEFMVRQNLVAAEALFEAINAPVEIRSLEKRTFPLAEVPVEVSDSQTFAMLCMLPLMTDEQVMIPLYTKRERDYAKIRQQVGEQMWLKARSFAGVVNTMLAWRKQVNLFAQWGYSGAIDACIVEKPDRLVFKPTSNTFFNHGMPVIERNANGFYKIRIVPESRVQNEFPDARAISLDPQQAFGIAEPAYTFYYEEPVK